MQNVLVILLPSNFFKACFKNKLLKASFKACGTTF